MEREEKIKIAITSGIAAVILLLLVLVIALGGRKDNADEEKLAENITQYADASASPGAVFDEKASADKEDTVSEDSKSTSESDDAKDSTSGNESSTDTKSLTDSSDKKNTAASSVSGNSFYDTQTPRFKDVYKAVKYDRSIQMSEMYGYWSAGNMEAVRDLAHLERFEAMSYSLSGTNDFYYYGDTSSEGIPNGMGLAVYADDQYYYGQWVNGVRSGDGCWISFYPSYSNYVVTEHMYTGQWADDLPNGQGQEHYDYNQELMNEEDVYLQNAIGGFATGNYNGSMYVITLDSDGDTTEWEGVCENGEWIQVPHASKDNKGKIPVLSERENTERHLYMSAQGARGNGVSDITAGGSIRK